MYVQVLSPDMSLATVRAYVWKKSEDLVLNYRVVQGRWFCKTFWRWGFLVLFFCFLSFWTSFALIQPSLTFCSQKRFSIISTLLMSILTVVICVMKIWGSVNFIIWLCNMSYVWLSYILKKPILTCLNTLLCCSSLKYWLYIL